MSLCTCTMCGHEWRAGEDGGHDCAVVLKQRNQQLATRLSELDAALQAAKAEGLAVAKKLAELIGRPMTPEERKMTDDYFRSLFDDAARAQSSAGQGGNEACKHPNATEHETPSGESARYKCPDCGHSWLEELPQ